MPGVKDSLGFAREQERAILSNKSKGQNIEETCNTSQFSAEDDLPVGHKRPFSFMQAACLNPWSLCCSKPAKMHEQAQCHLADGHEEEGTKRPSLIVFYS